MQVEMQGDAVAMAIDLVQEGCDTEVPLVLVLGVVSTDPAARGGLC